MSTLLPRAHEWPTTSDARSRAREENDDTSLSGPQRSAAIACVLGALVLVVLDASMVSVALPAIARAFHVTAAESVRVVTATQLSLVMALLPCAALGESIGYRRVYTAGVALFVAASTLCAFAPSLPFLVAARFMQGLGGAAVMSLGVALLRFAMPQRELGKALGWNALAIALSTAAGPAICALVLSAVSWPWLFALHLPLGALVLLATRALPQVAGSAQKIDLVSAGLNAATFGALVMGAEIMLEHPVLAALLLATGALAMITLIRRELPRPSPMIPLDLLRDGSFRISVIASVCCFVGQSAAMVSLPFYLRNGLGMSTLQTGLSIAPWPLTAALVAPIAGKLASRFSGAWLCAVGGVLLAVGLAPLALWPAHGTPHALIPFVALCGAGFSLFQVFNNRNMFLSAPRARSGAAGGMQGTARLMGQTIGAVLMTLLFTTTSLDLAPRWGLGIAAFQAFLAGLVSTLRVSSTGNLAPTES